MRTDIRNEVYVAEIPELQIYAEAIIDNGTLYLTIDATHIPPQNVYTKVNSTNCALYIYDEPLYINYPNGIKVDPDTAKVRKCNGLIDITAKIVKRPHR
jgi:hypothetical protein